MPDAISFIGLEIAALIGQGADRLDIGRGVDMALGRIDEAHPEFRPASDGRSDAPPEFRYEFRYADRRKADFRLEFRYAVATHAARSFSSSARRVYSLLVVIWRAAASRWRR
jgi:hypothetical protein